MSDVTTITAVENYLLITIDDSFDDQVEEWIDAVGEYMNSQTDRYLIADETDQIYLYDGTGTKRLVIDDFISITKVEYTIDYGTTWIDITSVTYNYPANKTPKYYMESHYNFARGRQNIRITGKRGYAAFANFPTELKLAATVFLAGIINAAYQSDGEVQSETIGRYSVTYTTDAQKKDYDNAVATLEGYRRMR